MSALNTRLFFVWLLCAATATLAPFDFGPLSTSSAQGFTAYSDGSHQQDPTHIVLNMLLFVPLGALVYHKGQRSGLNLLSLVFVAGTTALLISFGVESLQRFLPSREPSLVDILANTAGALVGVLAGRLWRTAGMEFQG